ncbi:LPS translocon maturation chaperone LptM [Legionella fallonii]|uniref:Lipopeptide n=1 Tax=Legionella fallonii LLAP-10 TaxID=1212491 RepID=A0A098G826_9GAMM|nr:lipoprotein [Legionella fallonii]CEG58134.1 conserved exported protein of unknown function [Legionella fallonii LLAP-10]
MRCIKLALLVSVAFFCLTACGQKGPLYLPSPEKAESVKHPPKRTYNNYQREGQ